MKIGIDIVYIPEFEKRMKNADLEKVFLPVELSQNSSTESLAGVFSAKEAFFKAVGKKEEWTSVWIEKNKSGQPFLKSVILSLSKDSSISISHAGDYAVAMVCLE